jgi:hypothetical protein
MRGSPIRTYLAAVAPPHPPPITTTRRRPVGCVSPIVDAQPASPPAITAPTTPAPLAPRNVRRVSFRMGPPPRRARLLPHCAAALVDGHRQRYHGTAPPGARRVRAGWGWPRAAQAPTARRTVASTSSGEPSR